MNDWIYKGKPFTEYKSEYPWFVYEIELLDENNNLVWSYFGKKSFYGKRKKHFGKKKLAEITDRRLKKYEYIIKESNWKRYCSSSDNVKRLVETGAYKVERTILRLCTVEKEATYFENKLLYEAFENPKNVNENISGAIYKEEVLRWIQ